MLKNLPLALTMAVALPPFAADEHNVVAGLVATDTPLERHGVDPVFIELQDRVEGEAEFTAVHAGVVYYFAGTDHHAAFEKWPVRYLPQNDGSCS